MAMRVACVVLVLSACSSNGPPVTAPDAAVDVAADVAGDVPFTCTPFAPPVAGPACLALAPSALQGTTPFGDLDVALDYFGAGDCITISGATIGWRGACGEQLHVQFPYPVVADSSGRRVTQDFDANARFEFRPQGASPREHVTTIHVAVARWQEGQGIHDIDITVTTTDPAFALAPLRVQGTFCDWPYYVC